FIDILAFRQHELQERFTLETTGLRDGQHAEVLRSHSLEKRSRDLPLHGKLANGPFGHVVLPRNAVLRQEREKAFSVAVEPLLEYAHRFRRVFPYNDVLVVEPLDISEELSQVPGLQPKAINLHKNRYEQSLHRHGERLQFPVERS